MALGIVLGTVASFVVSAVLYAAPPVAALLRRDSHPRPGIGVPAQTASVVARSLVTAVLVAGLVHAGHWSGTGAGLLLGLALSVLPVTILSGAVVHENTPVLLSAVHALDWVLKLVVIGAIAGAFA